MPPKNPPTKLFVSKSPDEGGRGLGEAVVVVGGDVVELVVLETA